MANICSFTFQAKGKRASIQKVLDAVEQKTSELWIGRGAEIYYDEKEEDGTGMVTVQGAGSCKNSLEGALKLAAKEMETQRVTGEGLWDDDELKDVKKFMTIGDACKAFGVNIEFFSEETDSHIAEHVVIADGNEEWSQGEAHEEYNKKTGEFTTVSDYDGCGYGIGYPKAA